MTARRGNRHKRSWTKAKVQAAIRKWERKFGRPPTEADWNPARAKFLMAGNQERVDRWQRALDEYATGNYPSSRTLQDMYDGKWADGIKDAGFVPLPPGRPGREYTARYLTRQQDIDEAALGLCIDIVQKAMKAGTVAEQRRALLDLASIAVTLADELEP